MIHDDDGFIVIKNVSELQIDKYLLIDVMTGNFLVVYSIANF